MQNHYLGLGLAGFEAAPFFKDLPARMAAAHLVVGALGRLDGRRSSPPSAGPSILVPLPGALDQDQAANAATLAADRRRAGDPAARLHAGPPHGGARRRSSPIPQN